MNNQIPIMQKQQGSYPRLNSQGANMGANTVSPTSRIGVNNSRQVGVLYGHDGHGKVYNYFAGSGVKAGDLITPEVTKTRKDGKQITYKTLAKVQFTRDALGAAAQNTTAELIDNQIMQKTVGSTDQKSLPGYYKGWDKDAKAAKELYDEARLGGASDKQLKETRAYTSSVRQESKQKYDASRKDKQMQRLNIMGEPTGE